MATSASRAASRWEGVVRVLDAIERSGLLNPTADRGMIRLVRREAGGNPRLLRVDYAAITRRDATLNYPMGPGDRLVIYRSPVDE